MYKKPIFFYLNCNDRNCSISELFEFVDFAENKVCDVNREKVKKYIFFFLPVNDYLIRIF